ncbi:RNA polymerase sigma factor [Pedobacter sp. GSP4]|uniref:RNA polymerase sigma factor n=1 Tax=Pedobacter sp. GSP4 TaxID=3453716 RepID=UPI003EF08074
MQVFVNPISNKSQGADLKVQLSDQEVFIKRLRAKDADAFKILYQKYAAAVYGNIIRSLNDEPKSKLVLEQTFCHLWDSFSGYDERKMSIFTWINQITLRNIKLMA